MYNVMNLTPAAAAQDALQLTLKIQKLRDDVLDEINFHLETIKKAFFLVRLVSTTFFILVMKILDWIEISLHDYLV